MLGAKYRAITGIEFHPIVLSNDYRKNFTNWLNETHGIVEVINYNHHSKHNLIFATPSHELLFRLTYADYI